MTDNIFDIVVIGGGVAGYVGAIRATQLGMKVALVDKEKILGGTCLKKGCIPSKALIESSEAYKKAISGELTHLGVIAKEISYDLNKIMKRKQGIIKKLTAGVSFLMKKNKITVYCGNAHFKTSEEIEIIDEQNKAQTISAAQFLITTGSTPIQLPFLPFDNNTFVSSSQALEFDKVPKSLVVIGAGAIGLELGSVWSRFGTNVTIVEMEDQILPGIDKDIAQVLLKNLKKQKIKVMTSSKVTGVKKLNNKVVLNILKNSNQSIDVETEKVLIAIGRRPFYKNLGIQEINIEIDEKTGAIKVDENMRTSISNIFAAGDVTGAPMLAHRASEQAIFAVEQMHKLLQKVKPILDNNIKAFSKSIPAVVYTNPEVAVTGISETRLIQQNKPYNKGIFYFLANGRALSLGNSEGFVKILTNKENQIIGAGMIGHAVSELIAILVMAIDTKMSASTLGEAIYAHPSLSEAVKEAALGAIKRSIHGA